MHGMGESKRASLKEHDCVRENEKGGRRDHVREKEAQSTSLGQT